MVFFHISVSVTNRMSEETSTTTAKHIFQAKAEAGPQNHCATSPAKVVRVEDLPRANKALPRNIEPELSRLHRNMTEGTDSSIQNSAAEIRLPSIPFPPLPSAGIAPTQAHFPRVL